MTKSDDVPADVRARTGFCECGCGKRTKIWDGTTASLGRWRGYPARYLRGHSGRIQDAVPADVLARTGFCECGCGQATPIAKRTDRSSGKYAGHPMRLITGHGMRTPVPDDVKARDGICKCGCGSKAAIAKITNVDRGAYAGFPTEFAKGHQPRKDTYATWIGGDGYVYTTRTGHPNAQPGGKILEHRWLMSEMLGRPLRRGETVHHINGIRTDNRIENLQLRQGNHGQGARIQCHACGSHDVGPVALHE